MTAKRTYVSTTIPYVNARPHLGHALEFVQADVLVRHRRGRGDQVRFQTGTDDNSLKNVLAAQAAGVGVQEFVDGNAEAFVALAAPLSLAVDDVIRTSRDPRHQVGVHRLWRACAEAGDLYRRHYQGLYCVGCEQFYTPAELTAGRCSEHGTEPQVVAEENWFFRLSRYGDRLRDLIETGGLRISPTGRRNEVLGFIAGGLEDFSVSRSTARARGWGIPVPGDPSQVIYVWWDALGNYITALGYGTGDAGYERWWTGATSRVHVVGKGVLRFHAVYWPAILLSAGQPPPTHILVHDYLTIDGSKISKSAGPTIDPAALAAEFGTDALRWWLLRDVPRTGDADFTTTRLIARANTDLANGIGNLIHRTTTLIHRYRAGIAPASATLAPDADSLNAAIRDAPGTIDTALANFDFRQATSAAYAIAEESNRYINQTEPWTLAKSEQSGDRHAAHQLGSVLSTLLQACQALAEHLAPFLPDLSTRIAHQCRPANGKLPAPAPVFARLTPTQPAQPS